MSGKLARQVFATCVLRVIHRCRIAYTPRGKHLNSNWSRQDDLTIFTQLNFQLLCRACVNICSLPCPLSTFSWESCHKAFHFPFAFVFHFLLAINKFSINWKLIDTRAYQKRQAQVEAHPFFFGATLGKKKGNLQGWEIRESRGVRVRGIRARLGASQRNANEMINGHLRLANVEFGAWAEWGQWGVALRWAQHVCWFVCLFVYLQLSSQFELWTLDQSICYYVYYPSCSSLPSLHSLSSLLSRLVVVLIAVVLLTRNCFLIFSSSYIFYFIPKSLGLNLLYLLGNCIIIALSSWQMDWWIDKHLQRTRGPNAAGIC